MVKTNNTKAPLEVARKNQNKLGCSDTCGPISGVWLTFHAISLNLLGAAHGPMLCPPHLLGVTLRLCVCQLPLILVDIESKGSVGLLRLTFVSRETPWLAVCAMTSMMYFWSNSIYSGKLEHNNTVI
ncbi:hypothetical protein Naga_100045g22 [Nannochloropsis gaditana]|uniref:Uncharacterized protein n=1 Tax=Nannochloropsis gaditana TaxID=72520 RepID=W7U0P9_9STRA|nr:hypothetical protein Naga_100045g22 [Nannochloropsis gaditana]